MCSCPCRAHGSPSTSSATYQYDPIGNRIQAVENSVQTDYVSNMLNQYTAINAASPSYDDDGNMLATGSGWTLGWDGENRLVTASNANTVITNTYDPHSRRIRKQVADAGTPVSDKRFFYDGWSLLHEHDVITGNPVTHYLWGLDLSGSLQGAGGVGGLLAEIRSDQSAVAAADANGNITEYLNGQAGGILSSYAYDGFGKTIAAPGIQDGSAYLHRFSSKYLDAEIGWYYYGYRFYAPEIGRWPNRDPIGEEGGLNVYGMAKNSSINTVDTQGLSLITPPIFGPWEPPVASPFPGPIEAPPLWPPPIGGDIDPIPPIPPGAPGYDPEDPLWGLIPVDWQPFPFEPNPNGSPCPKNYCNKWRISSSASVTGGGVAQAASIVGLLEAHPDCCMDRTAHNYAFLGLGAGLGKLKATITGNDSSGSWIETPCIPWNNHVGFGVVLTAGYARGGGLGVSAFATPALKVVSGGPIGGFDATVSVYIGVWLLGD